jgi:hypothetical protein
MNVPIERESRSGRITGLSGFVSLLLILYSCSSSPEKSFSLSAPVDVPAGTPVTIPIPDEVDCCTGLSIRPKGGTAMLSLQSVRQGEAVFLLEADLPAGASKQYDLISGSANDKPAEIHIEKTKTGLEVIAGEEPVLVYNTETLYPAEGLADYYKRSGFIHPFYSPDGKAITDGFPVGHTHQHGIFFAWVNTTYRGEFTDFWNQQDETGTVAFKELKDQFDGPLTAGIRAVQEFQSLKYGPVLEEEWTIRVYRLPDYNVLDITSKQKMIGNDTLYVNKYHYGGLGIRLSAEWNEADSAHFTNPMRILTSEGIVDRDSANHSRPRWTAVYGNLEGSPAGVALFDHPSNFRYPQPVRVHPNMPYFVPTPSVADGFTLVPGQEYVSNYRIVSFDGLPDSEALNAMWRAYSTRMEVSWMEEGVSK